MEALARLLNRKGYGQRKDENVQLHEISQNFKTHRKTILGVSTKKKKSTLRR